MIVRVSVNGGGKFLVTLNGDTIQCHTTEQLTAKLVELGVPGKRIDQLVLPATIEDMRKNRTILELSESF